MTQPIMREIHDVANDPPPLTREFLGWNADYSKWQLFIWYDGYFQPVDAASDELGDITHWMEATSPNE